MFLRAPSVELRNLLEYRGEGVDVQRFREMRVKARGAGAFDVVRAAETGDGDHGDIFAARDPA
jgi:hypothetical protein